MSGIVGSRLNTRGSGIVGSLGTDGQILLSSGAGTSAVFETVSAGGDISFGGDTFGADKVIGSNDSYALSLETNNTTAITINTDGSINSPVQPTFHAEHRAGQSNMAADTDVTITYNTEVYDIGANFASDTFTAPATGKYLLSFLWLSAAIDHDGSAYNMTKLVTSNATHTWTFEVQSFFNSEPEFWPFHFSVVTDMDTSDTAYIVYRSAGGGASTTDVYGTTADQHFFSGCLVS